MINESIKKDIDILLQLFPKGFINKYDEFIAVPQTNLYFLLENVNSPLELKCKVLEWFSRDAYKSQYYRTNWRNEEYRDKILDKINAFLGTHFTREDIGIIYTYLGNNINRKLCIKFIESNYNLEVLRNENT